MPKTANPFRVQMCRELGAAIEFTDDVHEAFARVRQIEASEGRTRRRDRGSRRRRPIREGMRLLFRSAKLAVEPAGAAALAALMYPLRSRLEGKSVGVIVCGANIDPETFARQLLP